FVEVNPAAPENVPDATVFFGKQNQQVAQPEPTPDGESDTPSVDGDGRETATAIVSGQLQEEPMPSVAELLSGIFGPPDEAEFEPEPAPTPAVNAPAGDEHLLGEA